MTLNQHNDHLFHVLDSQQFDRTLLDELCALTTKLRQHAKSKSGARSLQMLLPHKRFSILPNHQHERFYHFKMPVTCWESALARSVIHLSLRK